MEADDATRREGSRLSEGLGPAQRIALVAVAKRTGMWPALSHAPETVERFALELIATFGCERMRRALHDIAEEWAGAECGEPVHAQEAYAIALARRMYTLAAEALKATAAEGQS